MPARFIATGGYTPSEIHWEWVASTYTNAMAGRAIVYVHGQGGLGVDAGPDIRADLERYADRGYVVGALTGGALTNWGNAAFVSAVDAYLTYLNATYGANVTRPMFIADSHGAPGVLSWAMYGSGGPARLGAAVLRVPAVNMRYLHDNNIASVAAGMETAFTDLAGLVAAYPTRDPSHPEHTARIAGSGIATRVRLDYNVGDTIIRAADVLAFSRATGIEARVLGGPSHAPWGYQDVAEQLTWLRTRG